MGKAQTTANKPTPQTDYRARFEALSDIEGDLHDLLQMCRVNDLLRENETTLTEHGAKVRASAWELMEFTSFQCTMRTRHLVARYLAAHHGEKTPHYGASPISEGGEV